MRIGIVAYWFNRGQAVVARQIRATLDGLGHETFVLARPTRKTNIKPGWVDTEGVWAQERVTAASDYLIPAAEYRRWAEDVRPDLVLFDHNYQFDEIAQLRESGVRTIGRFVWEHFADEHVEPAGRAFDRIYSLTACEQERYAGMGIETPRVRWGCFPDLVSLGREAFLQRGEGHVAGHLTAGVAAHAVGHRKQRAGGEDAVLIDAAQAAHVGGRAPAEPGHHTASRMVDPT